MEEQAGECLVYMYSKSNPICSILKTLHDIVQNVVVAYHRHLVIRDCMQADQNTEFNPGLVDMHVSMLGHLSQLHYE